MLGLGPAALGCLLDWRLILRAALIVGAIALILTALRTEPIANVFGAFFIGPIVAYVLSALLLGERVSWARTVMLALGFAGVLLVVRPGGEMGTGMIFAVMAGTLYGSYLAATRWLTAFYPPLFLLGSQLVIGAGLLLPAGLASVPASTDLRVWVLVIVSSLASAFGNYLLVVVNRTTPATVSAPGTGKTQTKRLWTYARDERPWGGTAPPAAWYRFSGDRKGQHPKDHLARFRGWMHADGYAGFEDLYRSGAIREVACMAHVRRKFVDIHRSQGSPIAEEAIGRIAQLYAVEKEARGSPPDRRTELRRAHAAPAFDDLERWLAMQLATISGKSPLAAAIRYALTRMERLRPYLDNGILELDNNAAERGMRAIALGRKNYLFVGSEAGGKAAAIAYTLIETAKLNAIDPHAWLADTIARIPDYKITKIDDLLPWRWNG